MHIYFTRAYSVRRLVSTVYYMFFVATRKKLIRDNRTRKKQANSETNKQSCIRTTNKHTKRLIKRNTVEGPREIKIHKIAVFLVQAPQSIIIIQALSSALLESVLARFNSIERILDSSEVQTIILFCKLV